MADLFWQFTFDLNQGHQVIQLPCDLALHRWEHMRIDVQVQADIGVPQALWTFYLTPFPKN